MAIPLSNLTPSLIVSKLCLGCPRPSPPFIERVTMDSNFLFCFVFSLKGTMTFGEQNSLSQSFKLLDKAFDYGINFFDSAEMYPVPQRAETQGRSEEYFGRWLRERKIPRDRVVFATKVSGPSGQMSWIRGGPTSLDRRNIKMAIDNRLDHIHIHIHIHISLMGAFCMLDNCCSLLRLQTDYIDLYQLHWPDRYVPMFGETDYDPVRQYSPVSFDEQLDALGTAVDAGKIRFIGVSNETPYGVMKFLQAAENNPSYPRITTVQNSYNLLCRNFDSGLAECCHLERVRLLAYSPLAMGLLSGKYMLPDGGGDDARLNLFKGRYSEGESRYNLSNPTITEATKAYVSIAERYGIHPVSLAIGFVLRHPLVSSAIFGATKLWQLEEVVNACDIKLSPEIIADIDEVHSRFPNPCS
uniref:NADP-dependent oxidoreductase domain-containing protein n=1 Tax=Lactuca sativa TaxID=4236 RepID=A0A9R1XGS6_LACSA|nr:hypothetical protein LSAT_V11C500297380 [Lactuca sativa]